MRNYIIIAILTIGIILGGAYPAEIAMANEPVTHDPSSRPDPSDTPTSIALSLDQAIELSIKNNLATLLARERNEEAKGRALESLAALMPNLSATAYQASSEQNLAATGLQSAGIPIRSTILGPFDNFDARLRFAQSIFNLSAIRQFQAGRVDVSIAGLQEQLARQQVATATTIAYLNDLRSSLAVEAAESNLELAQSLFKLAKDQRNAGTATGVDVARAQTRVAQEQVQLAQAETAAQQARLQLQRVVGLPLGGPVRLTDSLRFTADLLPSIDAALAIAEQNRVELRIAQEQVKFNDYNQKAAKAELLPSLDFVADYGLSGTRPTELALPTRSMGIRLSLPIFNGGLTRGRIAVAKSRKRQSEMQLNDLQAQVEQDVRLALQTLTTTAEQVRAAEQSLTLAQRELQMARDRFAAGVGDNVEVINAQTALANARDAQVLALAQYNASRVNLAAALGQVESFRW